MKQSNKPRTHIWMLKSTLLHSSSKTSFCFQTHFVFLTFLNLFQFNILEKPGVHFEVWRDLCLFLGVNQGSFLCKANVQITTWKICLAVLKWLGATSGQYHVKNLGCSEILTAWETEKVKKWMTLTCMDSVMGLFLGEKRWAISILLFTVYLHPEVTSSQNTNAVT